jgi:serine/threonine-protein kinase RsbW
MSKLAGMVVIPSELRAARSIERALLGEIEQLGYSQACAFAIRLALEEALNNAIKHGNSLDSGKQVRVEYDLNDHRAVFIISDEGKGFNPADVPDPTADENLEKPSGRGIMLMRFFMDEVEYNSNGNQVRMLKRRC